MVVRIPKEQFLNMTRDAFSQRVKAFQQALAAHSSSIGTPAPTEHPLIEEIASKGGAYVVVEEAVKPHVHEVTLDQLNLVLARVAAMEGDRTRVSDFEDLRERVAKMEVSHANHTWELGRLTRTLAGLVKSLGKTLSDMTDEW